MHLLPPKKFFYQNEKTVKTNLISTWWSTYCTPTSDELAFSTIIIEMEILCDLYMTRPLLNKFITRRPFTITRPVSDNGLHYDQVGMTSVLLSLPIHMCSEGRRRSFPPLDLCNVKLDLTYL